MPVHEADCDCGRAEKGGGKAVSTIMEFQQAIASQQGGTAAITSRHGSTMRCNRKKSQRVLSNIAAELCVFNGVKEVKYGKR